MENEPATTDGREIRRRRKGKGLTLAELAGTAGITAGYLCKIEKGQLQGGPKAILAIAAALGARFEDITNDQFQSA